MNSLQPHCSDSDLVQIMRERSDSFIKDMATCKLRKLRTLSGKEIVFPLTDLQLKMWNFRLQTHQIICHIYESYNPLSIQLVSDCGLPSSQELPEDEQVAHKEMV